MNLQQLIICMVIWVSSLVAQSVRFELESGDVKCMLEEIKSNEMIAGHYSVVNPNEGQPLPESHRITVKVHRHPDKNYHHLSENVHSGQFSFQAVESGVYLMCFYVAYHQPPLNISIEFDWKTGVAATAKDWSNVAKKGSVDAMEYELKKLADTITSIHEEMLYLRERKREIQELNNLTNSRMAWLSFLSLFICLSVAGTQVWHLKSFFEKKKLI